MYLRIYSNNSAVNIEQLIADEVKRLSAQFGKSFLDCDDIIKLTGLGRDNVRALMRSRVVFLLPKLEKDRS